MVDVDRPGGPREVELGAQRPDVPHRLPVLPLRETVTFPDTMVPLAVGQPRSIELINDVLGGDRMIVMVASRESGIVSGSRM